MDNLEVMFRKAVIQAQVNGKNHHTVIVSERSGEPGHVNVRAGASVELTK